MNILVLSDSHSALSFMRRCLESVKPDAVVHLGDYFEDAQAMQEEFPGIPFYLVPGNCDRYRCPPGQPEILVERIFGVDFYLTHGHKHSVKAYLGALLRDARACGVQAALYGHTHWRALERGVGGAATTFNPGSLRDDGSYGVITIENGQCQFKWKKVPQ